MQNWPFGGPTNTRVCASVHRGGCTSGCGRARGLSDSTSWGGLVGLVLELVARLLVVVPVVGPGLGVGTRGAAHHGEHLAAAGAEEPRRQDCGKDQEGDVEPSG